MRAVARPPHEIRNRVLPPTKPAKKESRKTLFVSNRPSSEGIGIWTMEADRSQQRDLTTSAHVKSRPSWQPGK